MRLPSPPWIAGHRGSEPELENTLASYRRAVADGADLVEVDVQLTRDGRLVLFHDATLERLAGADPRRIEELPEAALRRVALRDTARRALPDRIPFLEELFASLPAGFPVNLEAKRFAADPGKFARALVGALAGRLNVLVSSFDEPLLEELRRQAPVLPLAPLAARLDAAVGELAARLGAWSLHLGEAPEAGALRALPWPVLVYTVNDPRVAGELLARGVAGLFTDRPGWLRRQLAWVAPPRVV